MCRATGATALVSLGAPTADELGFAKSLEVEELGGQMVIRLEQEGATGKVGLLSCLVCSRRTHSDQQQHAAAGVCWASPALQWHATLTGKQHPEKMLACLVGPGALLCTNFSWCAGDHSGAAGQHRQAAGRPGARCR